MSRIGKKPIQIPEGVSVDINGSLVRVHGPKGEVERLFRDEISIEKKENAIVLAIRKPTKLSRALWGTYASHLRNMVDGVTKEFSKRLEIQGIGYRAQTEGQGLSLSLGFSHPVKFQAPSGIKIAVEKNIIVVSGVDKEKVGQVASQIRSLKPPEPYKGKGIRYENEVVRRKAGKKAVGTGA